MRPTIAHPNLLGEYALDRLIGYGTFSKVRLAKKDGVYYAAKILKNLKSMPDGYQAKALFQEASAMKDLSHKNILKLIDYSATGVLHKTLKGTNVQKQYLIFELATGGELYDYVAVGGPFHSHIAKFYLSQLLDAVGYLHSNGYSHRDIKADNVLLDQNCVLKLSDFGFSTPIEGHHGTGIMNSMKGTPEYAAPEILNKEGYSGIKVDIYALGVLLFLMVAKRAPFNKAQMSDLLYSNFCLQNELYWKTMESAYPANTFSNEFKDLINSMLSPNPHMRPSISEILCSPYMTTGKIATLKEATDFLMKFKPKASKAWIDRAVEAENKAANIKREKERILRLAGKGYKTQGSEGTKAMIMHKTPLILPEFVVRKNL